MSLARWCQPAVAVCLLGGVAQVTPVAFDPVRTVSGSPQQLEVTGGAVNDMAAWTQLDDCSEYAGSGDTPLAMINAQTLCTKRDIDPGLSSRSYSSASSGPLSDGRLESLTAWRAANSDVTQWYKIDVGRILKLTGLNLKGRADAAEWLQTFYAVHSQDGSVWSQVDSGRYFSANVDQNSTVYIDFETEVVARYIRIHPLTWNGALALRVGAVECGGEPTATATRIYTLPGPHQHFPLHTAADSGTWNLCYKLAAGVWTRVHLLWLAVIEPPDYTPLVTIAGSITPITFLGSPYATHDSHGTTSQDGDFIVFVENNCDNAHTVVTGTKSLGPTALDYSTVHLDVPGHVLTTATMTSPQQEASTTVLQACFASRESHGDSADDYMMLNLTLTQKTPIEYEPRRAIAGAAQIMDIGSGGGHPYLSSGVSGINTAGDQIVWTQAPTCGNGTQTPPGSANAHSYAQHLGESAVPAVGTGFEPEFAASTEHTLTRTVVHSFSGVGHARVSLHRNTSEGTFHLCYRLQGGLWTQVADRDLTMIGRPTFDPPVGVSGSEVQVQTTTICNSLHLTSVVGHVHREY